MLVRRSLLAHLNWTLQTTRRQVFGCQFSALVAVVWQKIDPILEFGAADGPFGQKSPGQNGGDEGLGLKANNRASDIDDRGSPSLLAH
jgi:hypothetical protein